MPIPDMPTDIGRVLQKPEAIQEALEKLAGDCQDVVECQLSFALTSGVRMPESWFKTAVSALLQNAVDAAPPSGGKIRLDATEVTLTEPQPLRFGQPLAPGSYISIAVCDNGAGLSDEALVRCIEPGYSTRPGHSGRGLPSAYGVAVSCKGGLDILNVPGGGALATLYLPVKADLKFS